MPRNKKITEQPEEKLEDLPFAPPEIRELAERYVVEIPITSENMHDRWKLRLYAEEILERRLGDTVQLTSLKVKKPHLVAKTKARLRKRVPVAHLYVTVKF